MPEETKHETAPQEGLHIAPTASDGKPAESQAPADVKFRLERDDGQPNAEGCLHLSLGSGDEMRRYCDQLPEGWNNVTADNIKDFKKPPLIDFDWDWLDPNGWQMCFADSVDGLVDAMRSASIPFDPTEDLSADQLNHLLHYLPRYAFEPTAPPMYCAAHLYWFAPDVIDMMPVCEALLA